VNKKEGKMKSVKKFKVWVRKMVEVVRRDIERLRALAGDEGEAKADKGFEIPITDAWSIEDSRVGIVCRSLEKGRYQYRYWVGDEVLGSTL
jgi:hypothetical protein